ncbi:hypothetical protein B0H65DRAFT_572132 [Neurospora tetraspora]|uniref:CCHC-type domain-containing protein n=1 Tax=Neurospora tetraspora TaxID=94610 RepID=A0AAE0MT59_9PEZI|nr:hypothetical protein B0H65DRAFT_572132 [Neurospora tetraspora]
MGASYMQALLAQLLKALSLGQSSGAECYKCGEVGHIARNCSKGGAPPGRPLKITSPLTSDTRLKQRDKRQSRAPWTARRRRVGVDKASDRPRRPGAPLHSLLPPFRAGTVARQPVYPGSFHADAEFVSTRPLTNRAGQEFDGRRVRVDKASDRHYWESGDRENRTG